MSNKIPKTQLQTRYIPNGVKKLNSKETYSENFYNMLNKLISRAEREVAEYGSFAPVFEEFKNTNPKLNIDRYQLKILKMPKEDVADETKRFIEATVFAPAGDYKANLLIGSGTKEEILKQLKSEEFVDKLNNAYIKLVDVIQNP